MSKFARSLVDPRETDVRTAFATGIWSATSLAVVVLAARRASGAFTESTTAWLPCLASTAIALLSLSAFAVWTAEKRSSAMSRGEFVAALLTLGPTLGMGLVLWRPSSAFTGAYLLALFVAAGLGAILIRELSEALRLSPDFNAAAADSSPAGLPGTAPPCDEEAALGDPTICQALTRRKLPHGREVVEGSVRVDFAPGEKMAAAHVGFVPPLPGRPKVECHVLGDFDGRTRVAAAQPYGLRLEARRTDAANPAAVDVAFTAEVGEPQATAA